MGVLVDEREEGLARLVRFIESPEGQAELEAALARAAEDAAPLRRMDDIDPEVEREPFDAAWRVERGLARR